VLKLLSLTSVLNQILFMFYVDGNMAMFVFMLLLWQLTFLLITESVH